MHFKMSSAICFNLDQSKILLSVNGLNYPNQVHDLQTYEISCLSKRKAIVSRNTCSQYSSKYNDGVSCMDMYLFNPFPNNKFKTLPN